MGGHWRLSVLGVIVATAAGCGGGEGAGVAPSRAAGQTGPHGGPTVVLPDGVGVAEVLIERPSGRSGAHAEQVVAYFLGDDGRTAAVRSPSAARVVLEYPDREPATVELALDPKVEGAIRFASRPGSYMVEPLIGELVTTWDGRSVAGRFASMR